MKRHRFVLDSYRDRYSPQEDGQRFIGKIKKIDTRVSFGLKDSIL